MKARASFVVVVMLVSMSCAVTANKGGRSSLRSVPFTDVKITDTFWSPRIETNRVNTIRHDIEKCEQTGRISNFAKAGGLMEGKYEGALYNDSDVYKVLEGAAYSLSNHPDAALEKKVDEIINKIASAQQKDGYLNSYYTLTDMSKRWTNLGQTHELYCAGHLYEAAVAYYQATGKRKFLDVALKNADYIDSVFGPGKRSDVPGHEEIELALVKLYRVTGQEKYLNLAKFFLDERGHARGRKLYGKYCQDHKPVCEQSKIVGHAVRAMYLCAGVADVAGITGDKGYVEAMNRLWGNLVGHKLYITGGIGAIRHGEQFGGDYELPNASAYAETCAAIGLALWSHRLNLMHRDANYFDVFERALYNGVLSGVSLDGIKFFYVNPLESDGVYQFNHGANQRQSWFSTSCCPTNVVRFLPSLSGYMYVCDEDGVYVNLYAASKGKVFIKDQNVTLIQETRYPWNGKVKLTLKPEKTGEFNVNIRIPGWCRGLPVPSELYRFSDEPDAEQTAACLRVNGNLVPTPDVRKGYVCLSRKWKDGDVVELDMPMPVRRVKAHPKVKADEGRVALERGPLVYCLEEVDNGDGIRHAYLPKENRLTWQYCKDLLGGVVVVKGRAMARYAYGEPSRPLDFVAVPYYSWSNRGAGKMVVWIPEREKYCRVILRPTIASESKITVSFVSGSINVKSALNDRIEPANSNDHEVPRFTWWDHKGTKEWVQYDFRKPTNVSTVEVYWFDDEPGSGRCRVPQSWRVLYKNNDQWKEVSNPSGYGVAKDNFNSAKFDPVHTTALRLDVQLQPEFSGGILEWRVDIEE